MSGQALDLKRSAQIVRRHKILVGAVAALGLLAGRRVRRAQPADAYTSSALVVLPPSANDLHPGRDRDQRPRPGGRAAAAQSPACPLDTLRGRIQVRPPDVQRHFDQRPGQDRRPRPSRPPTRSPHSYVAYVGSAATARSGRCRRRFCSGRRPPRERRCPVRLADGRRARRLLGALIGAIIALALGRRDRRLRERDEIADAIGVPVLASIAVRSPVRRRGLDEAARGLRTRSRRCLAPAQGPAPAGARRHDLPADVRRAARSSLAVLSLSSDRKALALGPQLAVFAASLGIPTALVVGPQQDANATATLRAACAAPRRRPGDRGICGSP